MDQKKLWQSKTFWTGMAAVIVATGGYFTGEMELGVAIQTGFTGLIGIFLRSGMLNG